MQPRMPLAAFATGHIAGLHSTLSHKTPDILAAKRKGYKLQDTRTPEPVQKYRWSHGNKDVSGSVQSDKK